MCIIPLGLLVEGKPDFHQSLAGESSIRTIKQEKVPCLETSVEVQYGATSCGQ